LFCRIVFAKNRKHFFARCSNIKPYTSWRPYVFGMIDSVNLSRPLPFSQPNRSELKAGREFEAVLLTGFIEQMLPQNMGGTDAPEAGADVWRSFMAQAVADQLAGQNVTGLSRLISDQLMQVREANSSGA
jgi:Rod binding domain-containing protein